MTQYVVLRRSDDDTWVFTQRIEASSAAEAIRLTVRNGSIDSDYYVAVPSRSWNPIAVTVETVQRIRLK